MSERILAFLWWLPVPFTRDDVVTAWSNSRGEWDGRVYLGLWWGRLRSELL